MKLLIYGSRGWIGQQVVAYLEKQGIDFVEGQERVENTSLLEQEIDSIKPTNILCLIGRTHGTIGDREYGTIDYLEQKGKIFENVRDNLFSPVSLALLCYKKDIHLTCLNTGCIFTYKDDKKIFTESDVPNFFGSGYSVVKGFTDQIMHMLPTCNLRIRMPVFSIPGPRNFITKITNYEKICSVANSMTVLDDMIPIMVSLCQKKFIGTINLTNPGVISHNEILEMYKEIVDPNFTWKNFTYEEQMEILASERSNNELDTTLLSSLFDVPDIKESVRKQLEIYKSLL